MRTVLQIMLALALSLGLLATLPSCGAYVGAGMESYGGGYYNDPFGYDYGVHYYDGLWHNNYVYYRGRWYYRGWGTPYEYDYYYPNWW